MQDWNSMDKREKLVELINFYAGGSQASFCRKTGMEKSALSRMVTGQMPVTEKQVLKIAAALPEAKAFLEGRADLPRQKTMLDALDEKDAEIARLREEVAIKNRMIDALLSKAGF